MSSLLTREAILSAPVATTLINVPAWGGSVHVRALSLKSRMTLTDAILANQEENAVWIEDQAKPEDEREGVERVDLLDHNILTILHGIVDENGCQMFSMDDYDRFTELDYSIIVQLWVAMNNHAQRDPEEIKKNSA